MIRGEFVRGDGLVLPNHVTGWGSLRLLSAAFKGTPFPMWMALGNGVPVPIMDTNALLEPEIGVGGYARVDLAASIPESWPTVKIQDAGAMAESRTVEFTATGDGFSRPITRVALVSIAAGFGQVFSVSSPLPTPLTITPETPAIQRTFQYRIYI